MKHLALVSALAALGLMIAAAPPARADEVYTFVVKKQEEKQKTRWSITEWLETRDKMRLQDLWLALHSPSPYEFYVGADYQSAERASGRAGGYGLAAAAYASIFGIELSKLPSFDTGLTRLQALLMLRVFGFHAQGTNITLEGGARSQSGGGESSRNPIAGVHFEIGISKFFGVGGRFAHAFESTPAATPTSGNRYEGGAYIDFSMIRLYGQYFVDHSTLSDDAGFGIGTRVYF